MACGGCAKRRDAVRQARSALQRGTTNSRSASRKIDNPVMGGYKFLPDRQIRARLEVYKRRFCKNCEKRYDCTYETYVKCKGLQK